MPVFLTSPIRIAEPLNGTFSPTSKCKPQILCASQIINDPSQCAGHGFWMNWDRMLTTYAASGRETTTGHSTLPIASLYGTPCILLVWFSVAGDWSTENCAPGSIGVDTGLAWVTQNFSTILSM